MQDLQKKSRRFRWLPFVFFVWLIMNIRVEAGISSTYERALDGLVGIVLILAAVFVALDFFQIIEKDKK